jgi:hypothetical protein
MITFSIESLEQLNNIAYYNFNPDLNTKLIPFDAASAYVIDHNQFAALRTVLNSGSSYADYVHTLNGLSSDAINSCIATYDLYCPNSDSAAPVYFYPYSSKDFFPDFFPTVLPTLRNALFELLKSTGRIIQIGGGSGKAFVVKPQLMTEAHMTSLPAYVDPTVSINSMSFLVNSLSTYVNDNQFLYQMLEEKDNQIHFLMNQITELNNKITSAYQTTWR